MALDLKQGDTIKVFSWNFPEYAWGFKQMNSNVSIEKIRKCQGVFQLLAVPSSSRLFVFQLCGSDHTLYADEDSGRMTLCNARTTFGFELRESIGAMYLVKIHNSTTRRYLRHSNYALRLDECKPTDKSMEMDSLWLVKKVDACRPIYTPMRTSRELFLHVNRIPDAESIVSTLCDFFEMHLQKSNAQKRARLTDHAVSYPLQGAGGMEATASAISMLPSCDGNIDLQLRNRIEEATTVKSRGGVGSFVKPNPVVSTIIKKLARIALSNMKKRKMFGLISTRTFDVELGFCEWVVLPEGHEIPPHRDGGNDCDVAAIVGIANQSQVRVEDSTVTLKPGEMYIFEPQKYIHSVSKPNFPGARMVIALRFFRVGYSQ